MCSVKDGQAETIFRKRDHEGRPLWAAAAGAAPRLGPDSVTTAGQKPLTPAPSVETNTKKRWWELRAPKKKEIQSAMSEPQQKDEREASWRHQIISALITRALFVLQLQ